MVIRVGEMENLSLCGETYEYLYYQDIERNSIVFQLHYNDMFLNFMFKR